MTARWKILHTVEDQWFINQDAKKRRGDWYKYYTFFEKKDYTSENSEFEYTKVGFLPPYDTDNGLKSGMFLSYRPSCTDRHPKWIKAATSSFLWCCVLNKVSKVDALAQRYENITIWMLSQTSWKLLEINYIFAVWLVISQLRKALKVFRAAIASFLWTQ